LIKQPIFRQEKRGHERVAVASNQTMSCSDRDYCRARFLSLIVRTAIFFLVRALFVLAPGKKSVEVAFDRGLFSICWRILPRLPGEFSRIFSVIVCAARTQPNPDQCGIGLAKNRGRARWHGFEEDWRKIDYVNFAFTQSSVKIAQGMESPFHHEDRRPAKFSPDKMLLSAGLALAADRFAPFQLIMKVDNRRIGISRFGFVCPADFRTSTPQNWPTERKSNIRWTERTSHLRRDYGLAFTFSRP